MQTYSIAEIKAANPIRQVVEGYGVALKKAGREYVGKSPFTQERTPSFYVDPVKGVFKDFSGGLGGDVITFVAEIEQISRGAAIKRLAEAGHLTPDPDERRVQLKRAQRAQAEADRRDGERRRRKVMIARAIWAQAVPIAGTPAETYLTARGGDLEVIRARYPGALADLRYHAKLDYNWQGTSHRGPALIGAVRCPQTGELKGVHRTWLAPFGQGKADLPKAKLTLGEIWGGWSLLTDKAEHVIIGEGYETTLAVLSALARRGAGIAGASGLALGNIAGAQRPVYRQKFRQKVLESDPERPGLIMPDYVTWVTLLMDADAKSARAAAAMETALDLAAMKWRKQGVKVSVARPRKGLDFADMVG